MDLTQFHWLTAVIVMIIAAVNDAIWVLYIRRSGKGHAVQAAILSSTLILFGAFLTKNWLNNQVYLVPEVIGFFIGTFLVVKYDHKKKECDCCYCKSKVLND